MKVVQTTLSEAEHKLLEDYARRNSKTIKQVLREAVRATVEGKVDHDDPIFSGPPTSKKRERRTAGLRNTTGSCLAKWHNLRREIPCENIRHNFQKVGHNIIMEWLSGSLDVR